MTYTPNMVRSRQSTVRVDMWDSASDSVLLPISFCGAIPDLSITPAEISIRFSFLNFPYSRSINVENNSDLDGYFFIAPQTVEHAGPITGANFTYSLFMYNLKNSSLRDVLKADCVMILLSRYPRISQWYTQCRVIKAS